jgi:Galactoside-binding lectin
VLRRVVMNFSSKLTLVEAGQVITIHGKIETSALEVIIDLTEAVDEKPCHEVPFHLSLRFGVDDNEIVRNSHTTEDGWGDEERDENLIPGNVLNPIKSGDDFKVSIFIDVDHFFVSINDKPFCTYAHRSDVTQIRRLNITNDIETVYNVEHETAQPRKWPLKTDDLFRASIPRSFKMGDVLVIKGVTRGSDEGSFALNILDEDLKRPYFHMRTNLSDKTIKINSQCFNHVWGEEQDASSSSYPFGIDSPFKIAIIIKGNDFTFASNGEILCSMLFREDAEIMFLNMNGVEIVSREGAKVEVNSFEHFTMENEDEDFDRWVSQIIS